MKISVITVCRNSEKTIERTIQAVLSQTYPDIEYIVVEGASQDKTLGIIYNYHSRIPKIISEPDTGIYNAMNKGISLATGDFLYFANSDDYLFDENVIRDVVEFIANHPDCDCVYGDHEARFTSGDTGIYGAVSPERMLEEMICLGDDHLHQFTSFFRASLFQRIGLLNEKYRIAADHEWLLRLLQNPAVKLYYYPRTIVSYAHGGASGQIRALFEELFEIQNQSPICQQSEWLIKRLSKLQAMFVDKYDLLEHTNHLSLKRLRHIEALEARIQAIEEASGREAPPKVQKLEAQNQALKTEIEALQAKASALEARILAMESSKFWQIRSKWFNLKRRLGLPADE